MCNRWNGSRLGELTKNLNKSLLSINNIKISYIIDQFQKNSEFVVALGYKGELVKQFLELAYPEKKFFFVKVFPFKGKGSGLGLSLLKCEKYLKQPFVFTSCDTLVKGYIPKPNSNWIGYSIKKYDSQYRSISQQSNIVKKIYEKKEQSLNTQRPYIGLAGIYDYEIF